MASFFESPLFWVVIVWWLLATLLGRKARQRRAMQAQAASQDQPAAPFGGPQQEIEPAFSPEPERFAEIQVEEKVLEGEPPIPAPGPQEYPDRPLPTPPTRPVSPLESLFRGLGIKEDMIPAALRPEREGFPPVEPEAALAREPDISPEEEYIEPLPEPPPVEAPPARAEEYIPVPRPRRSYPLLTEATLARLTPLQQVVVFKEILDRPRALRRSVR